MVRRKAGSASETVAACGLGGLLVGGRYAASIGRSRHIARRANFLQDMHESGEIEPRHLPGEDTCADALTKPLDKKRFVRLREYLMNSRVAGNAAAG